MLNPFGSGVFPHVRRVIAKKSGAEPKEIQKAVVAEARKRQLQGDMVAAYDWDDIIRKVSSTFDVDWTISIAQLVKDYCLDPHIKLYPGVLEILTELTNHGHELRALTNGFLIYQYPVLEALGIAHFFKKIITPEAIGAAKPQRKFYLASQADAAKPHIHIGDTVIHDVWGANLVDAISIWVKKDLTAQWKELSPRQRALDPRVKELVQAGIDKDMCPECYPELELDDALPHYIIHHLSEISSIITAIKKRFKD